MLGDFAACVMLFFLALAAAAAYVSGKVAVR